MRTLAPACVGIAALSLGIAEGAFEHALKYSTLRKQFGQTISNFQGIQFRSPTWPTEIEAGKHLMFHAAWLAQNKRRSPTGRDRQALLFRGAMRTTIKAIRSTAVTATPRSIRSSDCSGTPRSARSARDIRDPASRYRPAPSEELAGGTYSEVAKRLRRPSDSGSASCIWSLLAPPPSPSVVGGAMPSLRPDQAWASATSRERETRYFWSLRSYPHPLYFGSF